MGTLEKLFGLDGLEQALSSTVEDFQLRSVRLGDIEVRPQVRTVFDEEKIFDLAQSIGDQGLQEPLTLLPLPGKTTYMLLNGERRYRALKRLHGEGYADIRVPCKIDIRDHRSSLEVTLKQMVDNEVRENLSKQELASSIKALHEAGMPFAKIATAIGKSPAAVSNICVLADANSDTQKLFALTEDVVALATIVRRQSDFPTEVAAFCRKAAESGTVSRQQIRGFVRELTSGFSSVTGNQTEQGFSNLREDSPKSDFTLRRKKYRVQSVLRIEPESGKVVVILEDGKMCIVEPRDLVVQLCHP